MTDPLTLVLAALATVASVTAGLFAKLLQSEYGRRADLERYAEQRHKDMVDQRDRLVQTNTQQQGSILELLAIIKEGVTGIGATGTATTAALSAIQRAIEDLLRDQKRDERR